jgi:hypothetical protein
MNTGAAKNFIAISALFVTIPILSLTLPAGAGIYKNTVKMKRLQARSLETAHHRPALRPPLAENENFVFIEIYGLSLGHGGRIEP